MLTVCNKNYIYFFLLETKICNSFKIKLKMYTVKIYLIYHKNIYLNKIFLKKSKMFILGH